MLTKSYPLLISSAISPPVDTPYLQMTNPLLRAVLTQASIYYWVGLGVDKIVIVDSTGVSVFNEDEIDNLSKLGILVEQLKYNQDEHSVVTNGKGYAEGKLVEFAIENSRLLAGHPSFYKSTGKTFVRNFKEINDLVTHNSITSIFWKNLEFKNIERSWVDSRFYLSTIDFAREYLISSYLNSDDKIAACEFHIYNCVSNKLNSNFSLRPQVTGFCGGTNSLYFDESLGYLDKSCPCWISQG